MDKDILAAKVKFNALKKRLADKEVDYEGIVRDTLSMMEGDRKKKKPRKKLLKSL